MYILYCGRKKWKWLEVTNNCLFYQLRYLYNKVRECNNG